MLWWNILWAKRAWEQAPVSHKPLEIIWGQNLVHFFSILELVTVPNLNKFGEGWCHNLKSAMIWYGLNKLLNKLLSIWANRQV